ncbi:MAG: oligogalacturonate lyase family protein [Anaerolineae bacterium]|nr:oligogalacturonate lyase family protein [Anaerolineae bacterium]
MRTFTDEKTGRTLKQLTTTGNNVHMYFTENSFVQGKNEIIFQSDRASGENKAPHEDPCYSIFRMNLDTGVIEQLSDDKVRAPHSVTKTPDGQLIAYTTDHEVKVLNMDTGKTTVVYQETGSYKMASVPSIASNRRYLAFCRNEAAEAPIHYHGANYSGFKERFYAIKDGRITLAYIDGSGSFDVFKDTHQVGHFQFSPVDPTLGMFCHEGPWNLVTQRIWFLDFISREVRPCFRQDEQDAIGHEFWTQDGHVFLDNRGPGHDGTITSDRTQAVVKEVAVNENAMIPFVALMDRDGNLVRKIDLPYYCNHYHANPDNTLLIGDDLDDLVLIDISGEKASHQVMCHHKTSWHTQSSHCHPTWDWDGSRILYASDFGGRVQLYLLEM